MDYELSLKMDELYSLLDEMECVKNIRKIKKNIPEELINLVGLYRQNQTISLKKKLYENEIFKQYIKNEMELNYLIMAINNIFRKKRGQCESRKRDS